MTVNGIIPAVQRSEKPCDSKQQSNCRSSQTRVETVPSISSRNQILAIAVQNTEKQISNLFGPFQFYWISFFCSKCFVWVCSLKSCYISLLKSIKSYLVSSIKFFFFFSKWIFGNTWINVLMKLIENLQVAQLSQSQLIKVKSFQSFRGVFRTQLKIFAFTSWLQKILHCRYSTGSSIPTHLRLTIKTKE